MAVVNIANRGKRELNFSEYEWPDNESTRYNHRWHFLEAVQDFAPEVLEELAGKPFVEFQTFVAEQRTINIEELWRIIDDKRKRLPLVVAKIIRPWARKWNIDVDWCCKCAAATLIYWDRDTSLCPPYHPLHNLRDTERAWTQPVHFLEHDPPISEADATFLLQQVRYEPWHMKRWKVEEKIRDYLDHVEKLCESAKMVKAGERHQSHHFLWLVHVQVQDYRPICVAEAYSQLDAYAKSEGETGLSDQAVRTQVTTLAKFLGLPPLGTPRGPRSRAEKARAKQLAQVVKAKFSGP